MSSSKGCVLCMVALGVSLQFGVPVRLWELPPDSC